MKTRLKGVIPALVTPFDSDGEIDEAAFRAQIPFMLGKGVHGVCVGGSTGEGHALEIDEFRRLIAITMEEVQGRVPVVAGIIANSTREVIARGRTVADLGVEAIQVTPTFYVFQTGEEALFSYFKEIWETVGTPVLLYNVIPWNLLTANFALRILHEIPGVVGIKQSGGDIHRLAELVLHVPEGKVILAAIDGLLYACFAMGAHGTLAASPTAAPGPVVALWDAVQAGDHARAIEIHKRLLDFWRQMPHDNLPACVKYALEVQGCRSGQPRRPMPYPTEAQQAVIAPALRALLAYDPTL
ncbi:MAG: dihydrodipicolinate synthase family protein [Devosia sp.]|nr:dihydrodipicolinate synthase family protein [Devosia sp.]